MRTFTLLTALFCLVNFACTCSELPSDLEYHPELSEQAKQALEERLRKEYEQAGQQGAPTAQAQPGGKRGAGGKGRAPDGSLFAPLAPHGDGPLSEKQMAAAKEKMREMVEQHPELREKLLEKFDADRDGRLSDAEKAKAEMAFKQRVMDDLNMRKKMEQRFDEDGDGKLNDQERAKAEVARKRFMAKFDTDGDGKLSEEERARSQAELQKLRPQAKQAQQKK